MRSVNARQADEMEDGGEYEYGSMLNENEMRDHEAQNTSINQ